MKKIILNKDRFQYDIHSLFKAFYGNEDVKVIVPGSAEYDDGFFEGIGHHTEMGELNAELGEDITLICFFDEEISEDSLKGSIALLQKEDSDNSVHKYVRSFSDNKSASQNDSVSTNGDEESVDTSKNAVKKIIYTALNKKTGKELPWGSLTGIRPTRIAMNLLEKEKSEEEIADYMKKTYFVSNEKIALSTLIAKREREILKNIDYENGYSLYIGIPFCPTTCLYCSFTSYPIGAYKDMVDDYIKCLKKEIDYVAEDFAGKTIDTVYMGGGTPTTLLPEQMEDLLGYLSEKLDLSHAKEFTVESGRPDSITREKLKAMKKMGVDRISVNPQTMRDETLKLIGRRHTVAQLIEAYNMAREEGFDNINMDIILGLPGENAGDVQYTMDEIAKLMPDDLTVHSLAIKRGSRLYEVLRQKGLDISLINNTEEMMNIASMGAVSMGLKPYYLYRQKNISGNFENTGYAKQGKAGIYNILINEEVQSIVALGAGTVTKRVFGNGRIERCDNVKDVKLYMEQIDEMIARKRSLFNL